MSEPAAAPESRVLVVDDEAAARTALCELLREEGFAVRTAADGFKALGQIETWTPDLIITDVKMPGMDGLEFMARARERLDAVGVVVMTAFGSVEDAVGAMQAGADDYLTKPVHFEELLVVVRRVLAHHALQRENARLRTRLNSDDGHERPVWIGHSKAANDLVKLARQIADSDVSVLVLGESGSGKELLARMLHNWSRRRDNDFVSVHCASLREDTLDRALLGDEAPGDRTETSARARGTDGGTLFLDEIAEAPPEIQVKLLRFLETQDYDRGNRTVRLDVRVVAATERDLQRDVAEGRFREDLFYRLNVVTLRVPGLRQRREDIPELAMHFFARSGGHDRGVTGFSDRALRVLSGYDWPGNLRQLQNCVERAVVLCPSGEIAPRHLPREVMTETGGDDLPRIPGSSMAELEKFAILKTLEHVHGSTSKAAEILGISPRKIQYRLAEFREADPSGIPSVVRSQSDPD